MAINDLIQQIPDHLSSLSKLEYLNFGVKNLTGSILAWIGKFSSLYVLNLCPDNLQGSLPTKLGSLSCLGIFQLYGNNPSGTIPPLIYNIFSINNFSVTENQLHGSLPLGVGLTLSNLQTFASNVNNFTGIVPVSLSNASQLQLLDFAQNGPTGAVP